MKIKIPYKLTLNDLMVEKGYGDIDYTPEPFHTRESLEATLRHKVLAHVMRSAVVEISPETLDSAFAACNSVVEDLELEVLDEPQDMLQITTLEEYENDRLNVHEDDDEDERWLERHYALSGVIADANDEYDTEALIKSALVKDYE